MAITKYKNLNDPELYEKCNNFIFEYNKLRSRLSRQQIEELEILSLEIGHKLKSKKCSACLLTALNKVRGYIYEYNKRQSEQSNDNTGSISNDISIQQSEAISEEVVESRKSKKRGRKSKTDTNQNGGGIE